MHFKSLKVWEISLSRLRVCLQGLGILELLCPLGVKYVRDAKPFYSLPSAAAQFRCSTLHAGILCQNNMDFKIQKLICLNAALNWGKMSINNCHNFWKLVVRSSEYKEFSNLFLATYFKEVFHPEKIILSLPTLIIQITIFSIFKALFVF